MKHTQTEPDIPIIYEDDHLLVIDKPQNVLSQADHTGDPDILSLCKSYLQKKRNSASEPYLGLVHRLDRPVSGLMMLAKNSKAAGFLSKQMKDQMIRKTYWAVVEGITPENELLTHHLKKDRDQNKVEVVPAGVPESKAATLSYQKLAENERKSLLAVYLQTGRAHQIRVQLSQKGFPIWGDYKYGEANQLEGRSIALRAVHLAFQHPEKQQELSFKLPPLFSKPWNLFDVKTLTRAL